VLIKYGWHGFHTLFATLEDDQRNIAYQDYTATMSRNLLKAFLSFVGSDYDPPSFIDIVYHHNTEKEPTKEEVINHILTRLNEV